MSRTWGRDTTWIERLAFACVGVILGIAATTVYYETKSPLRRFVDSPEFHIWKATICAR
jgi:hypothetical protein